MTYGPKPRPVLERLMAKVEFDTNGGCWLFSGSTQSNGYGKIKMRPNPSPLTAHRAMFEAAVGPVPDGFEVCHRCHVRCCVNPAHLYAGSHADNMQDIVRRRLS
jgi:hypothetical protein